MRTVYIDSEFKCHLADDGTMTAVETDSFDGMCDHLVEGYCMEPSGAGWHIYPWKPYEELAAAQAQYEADMADLTAAYREGVNSV